MPTKSSKLRLHEELLLIALRDEAGTVDWRASFHRHVLGGAILAELVLEERLGIRTDRRSVVELRDARPLNDPVLDECLSLVARSRRTRSAQSWISTFAGLRKLHYRIAETLCQRGVLREAEDRILLIFRRKVFPTIDARPERALRARLEKAVSGQTARVDARTLVLLSILHASHWLRLCLPREALRGRKKYIQQLVRSEVLGQATRAAIHAAEAAIAAASAATIAAATVSG